MNLLVFELVYPFARQNDEINIGKFVLVQPERIANDTTNAITIHGSTNIFFRNYKTDPGMIDCIFAGKNQDAGIADLEIGFVEYPLKIITGK